MRALLERYKKLLRSHTAMTLFASFVAVAFILLASSVTVTTVSRQRANVREVLEAEQAELEEQTEAEKEALQIADAKALFYKNLQLGADGAIVYDINTDEVLFDKNADVALPLASITKVMTVITAQDILPSTATIRIDGEALATEGESGLALGEVWSFEELADLMLIVSSNDAATAIATEGGKTLSIQKGLNLTGEKARALFIEHMNEKALEIGMEHAHFSNASGLDLENETKPSAVASSADVARLLSYALLEYPDILNHSRFGSYSVVSLNGRNFEAENTNDLADSIPGLLASKTGYTLQAGGNLAVVVDAGFLRPVVIVVLGSTREGRFNDVEKLYEVTKNYFQAL